MTEPGSARRKQDRMSYAEVAGLMRRGYVRPIPEPLPLHVMARRRTLLATTDSPAVDTNPKEQR